MFLTDARQVALAVEREQHRLEVGHHGLDLDHQQGTRRPMEGEDVDRASFAADVERHLGGDFPVGRAQDLENLIDESGMSRIKEAIQTLAVP